MSGRRLEEWLRDDGYACPLCLLYYIYVYDDYDMCCMNVDCNWYLEYRYAD